jgi:hypothetical protein
MCRRVRPEDFFAFAQFVGDEIEHNEAARRAVAHACYYAVYHLVVRHFRMGSANRGPRHADVRDYLSGLRSPPALPRHIVLARRYYRDLMDLREVADYRLDRPLPADDADRALQIAEAIFAARR